MQVVLDGHVYTRDDIEALRQDLIVYRNRALDAAPAGMQMAVVLSHVVGILAVVREEVTS